MVEKINRTKAVLVLATGRIFEGYLFGAPPSESSFGEVVFNTSITGYQEILTDPSYQGQIVVMTPSHIGNTGINKLDEESRRLFLSGFIVQELSPVVSNWRSTEILDSYLKEAHIAGMYGVDTRALTKYLRTQGAVNGLISTDVNKTDALIKKAKSLPGLEGRDLVQEVTSQKQYRWEERSDEWGKTIPFIEKTSHPYSDKKNIVVMDFGVKQNILRSLYDRGCHVTVVPANTPASDILSMNPDGVLLSNGPGDPAVVSYAIKTIQDLVAHNEQQHKKRDKSLPVFGICLGHQLLGLALGGNTFKLKFGHHGANHPVKDLETGNVDTTSQNHGFCVEAEKNSQGKWSLKGNKDTVVTHINLNDQSVEGFRHKYLPLFSVQYHPEASAGPHDSSHLFDRFMKLMENPN